MLILALVPMCRLYAANTEYPVGEYIDNWDFSESNDAPKNAFSVLPELVTEDGVTAGKADPYQNGKNTGFIISSWADVQNDLIVFKTRIKSEQKMEQPFRMLDSSEILYYGSSISVKGFDKILLTPGEWHELTLVLDLSEKIVSGKTVSNIKPLNLTLNGEMYTPSNGNTLTVKDGRNYIQPSDTQDIVYIDYFKVYTVYDETLDVINEDEETYPLLDTIDNFKFKNKDDMPTEAFKILPQLQENGTIKFDAYENGENTGFVSSSWKDADDEYVVFETRIKAEQKTVKSLHLLDANQIKYNGETLNVQGFSPVTASAGRWHKIVLVTDVSEKIVTEDGTTNIKPVKLIVNGREYLPVNNETISVTTRRNFIEPDRVDGVTAKTGDVIYMDYYKTYTSYNANKYLVNADFYRIPYELRAFSEFPETVIYDDRTTAKFSVSETDKNTGFEVPTLWENMAGDMIFETSIKFTGGLGLATEYFMTLFTIGSGSSPKISGTNHVIEENVWYDISVKMNLDEKLIKSVKINDTEYKLNKKMDDTMFNDNRKMIIVQNHSAEGTVEMYMDYLRIYLPFQADAPVKTDAETAAKLEADKRIIIERIKEDLKPTNSDDASTELYAERLLSDGTFSDLDYTSATDRMTHLTRTVEMSRAYAYENSAYFKNSDLLEKILDALRFFAKQEYKINTVGESGGWDLWLTCPSNIAKAMYYLAISGADIPDDIFYEADTYWFDLCHRTDGNARTFCYALSNCSTTASIWQYLAVVCDDTKYIDLIYNNVLKGSYNHTDGGEYGVEDDETGYQKVRGKSYFGSGLYPDWSYMEHGPMHYTFGYGRQLLLGGTYRFIKYAVGTDIQFTQAELSQIVGFLLENYRWLMRGANSEYTGLQRSVTNAVITGKGTNGARGDLITFCKYLLEEPNIPRRAELEQLLSELEENKEQSYVRGNRHYWSSDLTAHHRDGYFAAVKLSSDRTLKSETLGENGTNNFYMSDGQLQLYVTGKEYEEVLPVFDWDRLPGITAVQTDGDVPAISELSEEERYGEKSFAGGASDGYYGVSAMDYHVAQTGVNAKKSWFMFDDEIVALGAGISLDEGAEGEIATSVNQSILNGDVVYGESGEEKTLAEQTKVTGDDIEWVYHANIGYILPKNQNVSIANTAQTGNGMRSGETHSSGKSYTHDIFSLTLNDRAEKGSYVYIAVPGKTKDEFINCMNENNVEICSNTEKIQAVYNKKSDILQAVFYESGSVQTENGLEISVDKPCIVMIRKIGGAYQITMQNPENENISVNFAINKKLNNMTYDEKTGMSETVITNRTGLYAGESVTGVYTEYGNDFAIYPISVRNGDGNLINELYGENAEVTTKLYSDKDENILLYAAVYDNDGKLLYIAKKDYSLKNGVTADVNITIPKTNNINSSCGIKLFVWGDANCNVPRTQAVIFPQGKDDAR